MSAAAAAGGEGEAEAEGCFFACARSFDSPKTNTLLILIEYGERAE